MKPKTGPAQFEQFEKKASPPSDGIGPGCCRAMSGGQRRGRVGRAARRCRAPQGLAKYRDIHDGGGAGSVLAPMEGTDKAAKKGATAAKGRPTKGPTGYRAVGCGTLSFCGERGQSLSVVRRGRALEHKKKTLKSSLVAELTEALAKREDLGVVKLADGAVDNWTCLSEQVPEGPEVIDFFHAVEHLEHGLAAAYGEGTVQTRRKFAYLREELPEAPDGVEKGIRSLAYLRKKFPDGLALQPSLGTTLHNVRPLPPPPARRRVGRRQFGNYTLKKGIS